MGTYCSKQDLIDRFGEAELVERTDRTNLPPTTIVDAVLDRHIGDAEALANSHLAARYLLPLSVTPPELTAIVADIARYKLWGTSAEKDGAVDRAYRDALAWLQAVAKGLVVLSVGSTDVPAAAPSHGVAFGGRTKVFSERGSCR